MSAPNITVLDSKPLSISRVHTKLSEFVVKIENESNVHLQQLHNDENNDHEQDENMDGVEKKSLRNIKIQQVPPDIVYQLQLLRDSLAKQSKKDVQVKKEKTKKNDNEDMEE